MNRVYFSRIKLPIYTSTFDYELNKSFEYLVIDSGVVKIPRGLYCYIDIDGEVTVLNNNVNFKGVLYWVNLIEDVYINISNRIKITYQKFE